MIGRGNIRMSCLDSWCRSLSSLCICNIKLSLNLTTWYWQLLLLESLLPIWEEPRDWQKYELPSTQQRCHIVVNTCKVAISVGYIYLFFEKFGCDCELNQLVRIPELLVLQQIEALRNPTLESVVANLAGSYFDDRICACQESEEEFFHILKVSLDDVGFHGVGSYCILLRCVIANRLNGVGNSRLFWNNEFFLFVFQWLWSNWMISSDHIESNLFQLC